MLSFSLDREFVDSYRSLPEPFGYNGLGAVTFYRTYSRAKDDGSQESWVDVCERVINGMYSIQKDHAKQNNVSWSDEKAQRSAQEAFDGLFNLRWSPSGRGLWLMGSDFIHDRKVSEALLNCAFISTKDIEHERGSIFRWFMEMLMLGVGVGADVLGAGKVYVEKPLHATPGKPIYIEDTRESWAESIETLVNAYLVTHDHEIFFQPTFDYSKIRAKGEPIKGFGGISSGPEPLIELHDRVRKYLDANDGKLITTRTIADIFNAIGACVIAGNVRRSAEILLADFQDDEFINLKNYQLNPDRSDIAWASNNSLFAKIGSDYDKISNLILDNGEPGLAWMDNVQKFGRMGELKPDNAVGFNPCFAPGTLVHTKNGHYPIESLVGQDVDIWNGGDWQTVNNFRVTAQNQEILSIELQDGSIVRATPYHTFILEDGEKIYASDLTAGDKLKITNTPESHGHISVNGAYLKGFLVGDGTSKRGQQAILWLYAGKEVCSNRLKESALEINPIVNTNAIEEIEFEYKEYGQRKLYNMTGLGCRSYDLIMWATEYKNGLPYEVFAWNKNSKLEFLAGLFDSDGNSLDTTNGFGYQLSSVSKQLLLDVQALLKTLGIQSKVSLMRASANIDFGDGYGEYKTKDCYRLSIAQESSVNLSKMIKFERLKDFSNKNIIYSVKPRFNKIVSIQYDGIEEQVYCCTVDGSHQFSLTCGIDVGQCVEQPLAHKESCVSGDTKIQTRNGIFSIESLVGKKVEVWNGTEWSEVTPFYTGHNKLYRVYLSDGSHLDVTPGHEWMTKKQTESLYHDRRTDQLEVGMIMPKYNIENSAGNFEKYAYEMGWVAGDGYVDKSNNNAVMAVISDDNLFVADEMNWTIYKNLRVDDKYQTLHRISFRNMISSEIGIQLRDKESGLPEYIMTFDPASIRQFLAGWIDTDGCVQKNPNTEHIFLYGTQNKLKDLQILIRRIGINHSTITLFRKAGTETNFGVSNYDLYRLTIPSFECGSLETKVKKVNKIGSQYRTNYAHADGANISHARRQKIVGIELISENSPTYCFTEEKLHQGVFGNVLTKQCNLVEVYMNNHTDLYEYLRTLKFAYLYGKTVTLAYDWISDDESRYIMQENRRIGLSNTGIAQFLNQYGLEKLIEWLDVGYKTVQNYDDRYSTWLKVNKSIRLTTVKPSGSVSLLSGSTPGIHHPISEYYIRRIRLQNDTKLLKYLQDCGFYTEPDFYSTNTTVVEFPVHVADGIRKESDLSIWEQLELTAIVQQYWSDNGVSVTIKVDPNKNTPDEIARSLSYYQYKLKAVSMLPAVDGGAYKQMPYEEITEEKYRQIKNNINFDKLLMLQVFMSSEAVGMTDQEFELYCTSDACQIVYPTA